MTGGDQTLPPRETDPLLIDALRRHPKLPIGRFMGAELQDIATNTDEPTDTLLGKIDEARENLHTIHELGTIGEEY